MERGGNAAQELALIGVVFLPTRSGGRLLLHASEKMQLLPLSQSVQVQTLVQQIPPTSSGWISSFRQQLPSLIPAPCKHWNCYKANECFPDMSRLGPLWGQTGWLGRAGRCDLSLHLLWRRLGPNALRERCHLFLMKRRGPFPPILPNPFY